MFFLKIYQMFFQPFLVLLILLFFHSSNLSFFPLYCLTQTDLTYPGSRHSILRFCVQAFKRPVPLRFSFLSFFLPFLISKKHKSIQAFKRFKSVNSPVNATSDAYAFCVQKPLNLLVSFLCTTFRPKASFFSLYCLT